LFVATATHQLFAGPDGHYFVVVTEFHGEGLSTGAVSWLVFQPHARGAEQKGAGGGVVGEP